MNLDLYQSGLRPLLFDLLRTDPERAYQHLITFCAWAGSERGSWIRKAARQVFNLEDTRLEQHLWGLSFANPVGLAAGFDKDALGVDFWPSLGFGFAEVGTLTYHAQVGNAKPRLFRLPQDQAALNRMGFNNSGAAVAAKRLQAVQRKIPLGINLGKSKVTPLAAAAADYRASFELLRELGDYFVINVSSPNTPGLRTLQSPEALGEILEAVQTANLGHKPLLVKIAPDLEFEAIAEVLSLCERYQLAGIIATNTTISRDGLNTQVLPETGQPVAAELGGLSGAPLRARSTEVIHFIYQQTSGKLPIIGVGGLFTGEDAWDKIVAGASLVQVYTGWFYEGPSMVQRILKTLLQKLESHGFQELSEAVGLAHKKM
ncbi:quinone-dependent dihydroorotate dehydrogenase [Leptolyngbya sp. FACHB-261]|uniref:quinone-dependent dihydroorotate dehydrogenase n=1 Tax=Leptolyngbya sp. FACHB-261 TaxID=2692806 RepID=UPI00168929AA|nr:quinone-dependent dihydroorotate dehydrogenase [Leptolyngbya sp. FACHB-261]MBD2101271.1 quinone-dependent dihydroorotate dehydrogenase [Leptolyngbya sp. FACHB-261]